MTYRPEISSSIFGFVLAIAIIFVVLYFSKPLSINDNSNGGKIAIQYVPSRDYQIEIVEDSLLIFDGKRHVGTIPFHETDQQGYSAIDSLIMVDND